MNRRPEKWFGGTPATTRVLAARKIATIAWHVARMRIAHGGIGLLAKLGEHFPAPSLLAPENSLLAPRKFPVPLAGIFRTSPYNLLYRLKKPEQRQPLANRFPC
jgi:hypothetical protein